MSDVKEKLWEMFQEEIQRDPDRFRRSLAQEINSQQLEREGLEAKHGLVWDTRELQEEFEVKGFAAPMCIVKRKSDGQVGTVLFQHQPRYYFHFHADEEQHGP